MGNNLKLQLTKTLKTMVQAASRRDQVKQELIGLAEGIFENHWDSAEVKINDQAKQYVAKQFTDTDGIPTVLIKWHCVGLTAEQWARWEADPTEVAAAVNPKMSRTVLPDDDGHQARILKMKMPWPISDRSTVTVIAKHEKADGTKVLVHSSKGNDHICEANAKTIGKDVISNNMVTYMEYKAFEGGFDLRQVVKVDAAGSIPGWIKSKAASRMCSGPMIIVDYLQNGTVPAVMF